MGPTKPDKLLRRPFSDAEPIAKYGAETHIQPSARERHLRVRIVSGPVDVPAVLYSVNQDGLVVFEDLVDDSVVTAACRPEALEFAHQWFAQSLGAHGTYRGGLSSTLKRSWWLGSHLGRSAPH